MTAFRHINQDVTCAYNLVGVFGQARLPERLVLQRFISRVLKREHLFPILLHIDHGPALGFGFIEPFVELADMRLAVVGPFAHGIGVMHIETEARAGSPAGPLKHLQIAIRICRTQR